MLERSRISTHLTLRRSGEQVAGDRQDFGRFAVDRAARRVTRDGAPVHLTPKAFELLQMLIDERPRAIRKEELVDRLWPDVVVEAANLKNLIAEIRGALGAEAIRTVQRFGYAFGAEERRETSARLIFGDRVYRLAVGDNLIGRDDACAIAIDVAGVSRRHAAIRIDADRGVIEDIGSKNGTSLNGERISAPTELRDGDRILLGAATLVFRSRARTGPTTTFTGSARGGDSGRR
jgi:DNA-binding winged helix-turn-helix (wHTH) protein